MSSADGSGSQLPPRGKRLPLERPDLNKKGPEIVRTFVETPCAFWRISIHLKQLNTRTEL